MHVAQCPGGEQTQEEEMWNGVQSGSWVTKEQLASFSHEVGGGWVRELWCRARGTAQTHLLTPQAGTWDVNNQIQAGQKTRGLSWRKGLNLTSVV